jgi:Fic family protein/DNA-binding transcriptional ArsR family regulator
MSKQISPEDLKAVLQALARLPHGGSLAEIEEVLTQKVARRTLQRHLAFLVEQGKVLAEGQRRGRRYKLVSISTQPEPAPAPQVEIPISAAALSVQEAVTRPIAHRLREGYNREFLDAYRPNETFYLPEFIRQKLFNLGKSPDGKHPAGTYAREIFGRLLIDLSWNSSRLEGNTYSLLETERLLQLNELSEGKDFKDAQMILNHKAAIEFLVESALDIGINRYTIFNLHALLADNLLRVESCGTLRTIPVGIGGSVYQPPSVPLFIRECFEQVIETAHAIQNPFEQAFFLMVHLPYLQPFEDANKRVSRLAANIPLIRENLCPLSFVDVPEDMYIHGLLGIYELNQIELFRDVFVWAYERSCKRYSQQKQELGDPDPFRLKYRDLIVQVVTEIVHGCMHQKEAIVVIRKRAKELVPSADQLRLITQVERTLMTLHAGNIARYRISLREFEAWQKGWK